MTGLCCHTRLDTAQPGRDRIGTYSSRSTRCRRRADEPKFNGVPLSLSHQQSTPPGPIPVRDLAVRARRAIEALFSAVNYSDHRRARLEVREGVESYVRALHVEGTSRDATMRLVADLIPPVESSSEDGRYVQALRAELTRWSIAAYDGR
jgi:hypothetical protein